MLMRAAQERERERERERDAHDVHAHVQGTMYIVQKCSSEHR